MVLFLAERSALGEEAVEIFRGHVLVREREDYLVLAEDVQPQRLDQNLGLLDRRPEHRRARVGVAQAAGEREEVEDQRRELEELVVLVDE